MWEDPMHVQLSLSVQERGKSVLGDGLVEESVFPGVSEGARQLSHRFGFSSEVGTLGKARDERVNGEAQFLSGFERKRGLIVNVRIAGELMIDNALEQSQF
jgi:hypothetical protein